jgi:hypothetical protein
MSNVIKIKRKPRPLRATYSPTSPYVVERVDHDDGEIVFEVMDRRPDSYRIVCFVPDDAGGNGYAKHDAEQLARGLNLLVQYGKETLPTVRDNE